MPRKGKGQKVQTATGQQYGQAKMQEEAQDVVPLPQMSPPPRVKPGEAGPLRRPTERPNEPLGTMAPRIRNYCFSTWGFSTNESIC